MNDKIVWITGASSGIGEATALRFAKEGWKVAVSARRVELLNKLAENENIYSYPLDITDTIKIKVLVSPPNTPDISETCKALLGSPFCAIV